MEKLAIDLVFVFCISFALLFIFRKAAYRLGLVDKANGRKTHVGEVPLVGGVAICFTVIHYLYLNPIFPENNTVYMFSIALLTLVGALDDKFDVSFKIRIVIQIGVSLLMISYSGIQISELGDMFGAGNISIAYFGIPLTVLAVVGAINAFNMVDGIDGLLGGLSIVTFSGFAIIMGMYGQDNKVYICLLFVVSMVPYILMNLGLVGKERKVFMGDAGSMMIGFTVIWLLLSASQIGTDQAHLRSVTCLWLIAIPLMDMASIMIRRLRKGRSPFKPDREHLHHIFERLGLSSIQTLFVICFVASCFAAVGIIGELYDVPEYVMFYSFIVVFIGYDFVLQKALKKMDCQTSQSTT